MVTVIGHFIHTMKVSGCSGIVTWEVCQQTTCTELPVRVTGHVVLKLNMADLQIGHMVIQTQLQTDRMVLKVKVTDI